MRYNKDDLPREKNEIRERDQLPYSAEFVYRPLDHLDHTAIDADEKLAEKYRIAKEISDHTQIIDLGLNNEKSPCKVTKKKAAKVHRKTHKSAVAKI